LSHVERNILGKITQRQSSTKVLADNKWWAY